VELTQRIEAFQTSSASTFEEWEMQARLIRLQVGVCKEALLLLDALFANTNHSLEDATRMRGKAAYALSCRFEEVCGRVARGPVEDAIDQAPKRYRDELVGLKRVVQETEAAESVAKDRKSRVQQDMYGRREWLLSVIRKHEDVLQLHQGGLTILGMVEEIRKQAARSCGRES